MANEITGQLLLDVQNEGFKFRFAGSLNIDQSGVGGGNPGTVVIGTTEEAIIFTGITSRGVLYMKNLDETSYVDWGPESVGSMVVMNRLLPLEFALLRLTDDATVIRMQSFPTEASVLIQLYED